MTQPGAPVIAKETLWTYYGVNEEKSDKGFYTAMDKTIAAELAQRFRGNHRLWVGREIELRVGAYSIHARLTNVEPLLATIADASTRFITQYHERARDEGQDIGVFISETIRFPDALRAAAYENLVGLDAIKDDMQRKLMLLLGPNYVRDWLAAAYPQQSPEALALTLQDRYPLLILEGEVGSGKTALARSIGHPLSLRLKRDVMLLVMNAQVRGGGHVGELTQNLSRAFTEAERIQEREQISLILLIDEADALAQARGGKQTHHEDDAGVNTLIQRIDRLRGRPIAVIFATNLVQSLDSAIMRRAISTYHFDRPTAAQRAEVFRRLLVNTGISDAIIQQLVAVTEPRELPGYGVQRHRYTYSDLSQRLIPRAVENAIFQQQPLTVDHLMQACQSVLPTPESSDRGAQGTRS